VLGDLLIVTGIVHSTGGIESNFSFLYLISIISASIILFGRGGLVAATVASVLYGALVQALYLGAIRAYPAAAQPTAVVLPSEVVAYTIFLNVFAFYTVALLTSYLSESLRLAGRKLEEASDSLADLEAFSQTIIDSITSGLMTTDVEVASFSTRRPRTSWSSFPSRRSARRSRLSSAKRTISSIGSRTSSREGAS
jgi:two-component system sensor histidine kinase PilS (NtrC family)